MFGVHFSQVAMGIATVFLAFFVLFSGYIAAPGEIPDYWIWAYWANPISWAMRSLVQNEFNSDKYQEGNKAEIDDRNVFDENGTVIGTRGPKVRQSHCIARRVITPYTIRIGLF
jgi:hypothetical protein